MSEKRMIIDASHPEETRVVVIDGTRLEDFDVEVASRRQLKGNIYLAKVTRVEPSLQAAFVDYGGNRHGFLAFNEIHPDYYQIPVADREALLAEQEAAERAAEIDAAEAGEDGSEIGVDEDEEFGRRRLRTLTRQYKIQEVVKRRQIMLVQVVKEERGNKGAALTTYLSLAGRYCVLMPNTARGGGISRKITNTTDRRRLKKILNELDVPQEMAVIVRTAGSGRSKAEIKRDYEYLLRLWSNIRETTLASMAPTLVYEEANLIKRSIRDLYGRDIEEIVIQGEEEYRTAKEFMKLFIPSHAKRVQLYEDPSAPLFHRYGIEAQMESLHQMTVQLRSGGYIVINPTEALVAIDVNSGRATRERHIEETALRTNLEAADEISRQLRLRDLAGLIVIDFIDMENSRNQGQVERRLKEAMKADKARVQIGRISPFGLLELSRQRLRPSVLETSFQVCPQCSGAGVVRTIESAALNVLRRIEEEGMTRRGSEIVVGVPTAVALYLLNHKRRALTAIEERCQLTVRINGDPAMTASDYRIDRMKAPAVAAEEAPAEEAPEAEAVAGTEAEAETEAGGRDEKDKRGRRRRPRRRRRPGEERESTAPTAEEAAEEEIDAAAAEAGSESAGTDEAEEPVAAAEGGENAAAESADEAARRRRRRGKRGGRRRARRPAEGEAEVTGADVPALDIGDEAAEAIETAWSPAAEDVADVADADLPSTDAEAPSTAPPVEDRPEMEPAPTDAAAERPDGEATGGMFAESETVPEPESVPESETGHEVAPGHESGHEHEHEHASVTGDDADFRPNAPAEDVHEGHDGKADRERRPDHPAAAASTEENRSLYAGRGGEDDDRDAGVIPVEGEHDGDGGSPRRGWWQRLLD
jgi:ribonuclease E